MKPCPFCGGHGESYVESMFPTHPWCVRCKKCNCRLSRFATPGEAILKWNQRFHDQRELVEIKGDLFRQMADAICITTNGFTRTDGRAVMGRGCARQAVAKWPRIEQVLGQRLLDGGNQVWALTIQEGERIFFKNPPVGARGLPYHVVSFPVKHHWKEQADLDLIKRSAHQLMDMIKEKGWTKVILPRPGCGNGRLTWDMVKPVLSEILDFRVVVISPKNEVDSRQAIR